MFSALIAICSIGQLTDDFNYTSGAALTANGWSQISAGTGPLVVNSNGLSYASSPSTGIGFGVNSAPGQQVIGRSSTSISSGTAYMSLLINLSNAGTTTGGVNIAGIMSGTFPSPGVAARLFTRLSGTGFNFGISKTGITPVTWGSTVYTLNTTYLAVLKYTFNSSATDDIVDLFINPALGALEPAPLLSMGGTIADASAALFGPTINPRSGTAAPTFEIDAIRYANNWAAVTPSNVALLVSTTSINFGTQGIGSTSAASTFNLSGTNLTPAAGSITVTAPSVQYQVSNDNVTWNSSTTIPYTSGTLTAVPVYVRYVATTSGATMGNVTLSGGSVALPPNVAVSGAGGTIYYTKPTGSLSTLSSWGTNANGTGTVPSDFVTDYQIFVVANRATYTLDADFQIIGLGAKIVVGNGTDATKLILPANFSILNAVDNKVDVANNGSVEVANKIYRGGVADPNKIPFPYFGTVALNSVVEYSWNGTTSADTVKIPTEIFGNLKLTNGLKYFSPGFVFANGNLDIKDVVGVNGTGVSSSVLVRGNVTLNNSFFDAGTIGNANRVSLNLGGTGTQTLSGGDFYVNQLRTQAVFSSVPASTIDIVLAPGTNLYTGFESGASSGGGISLQQATHNLSLNGNTLQMDYGSIFTGTNQGTISGSATSNILINKTLGNTAIGTLRFKAGSELLNNLTYNAAGTGNNNLVLATPLTINGALNFVSGKILVGNNTLTAAGTITGASSNSYIVTNGTGSLKINNVGASNVTFPVGPSITLYNPVTLSNSGVVDNFSVNAATATPFCLDPASSVTTTWNITEETMGGSNCTIALDYTGSATGASYNPALAKIADCSGNSPYYNNGTVAGTVATGTGFTGMTTFGITSNIVALPLTFLNFSGTKINATNQLTWVTANEVNNLGFEVQRSYNGQVYTNIGFVNSLATVGNASTHTYSFIDNNVDNKVTYYRLRQVDNNTQYKYSHVLKLQGKLSNAFSIEGILPNPVHNSLIATIVSPSVGIINMQVVDMKGSIIMQKKVAIQLGANTVAIDIATLHRGTYVLKAICNNCNELQVQKFVKQ